MLENVTDMATSASAVVAVLLSLYVLRLQLQDKQELKRVESTVVVDEGTTT